MKTSFTHPMNKTLRSATFAIAALTLTFSANLLHAATGEELLMSALPPAALNQSVIDNDSLVGAVSNIVREHKKEAPEIVGAAITKTRSLATQKAIVKVAIIALGDYQSLPKGLIPQIVYSAIKHSPNCGTSEGASGYSKDGNVGCECAEQYTKAAIEALGANPSEKLVTDIVTSAIQALDGKCADRIVTGASEVAPQFASGIADAAARVGRGEATNFSNEGDPGEGVVFSPTGRPIPSPFIFPPAAGGGIVPDTTPVN